MNKQKLDSYYAQPEFYKFSEDSITLSRIVSHHIGNNEAVHLLDIGAGCGVVGIEVARTLKKDYAHSLKLIEKEKAFLPYVQKNISQFINPYIDTSVLHTDFLNYTEEGPITHIVCNPPYFFYGHGRISHDFKKNNCRFWEPFKAEDFLKHIMRTCRRHKAQGFLCGRLELETLMEKLDLDFHLLKATGKTFFYRLF